jgi:hypothetical protein
LVWHHDNIGEDTGIDEGDGRSDRGDRKKDMKKYVVGYMFITSTFLTSPNHHPFSTGLPPLLSILLPMLYH